jgi:hypothetical protein
MIAMRLSFLLVLVPLVARGDVAPPGRPLPPPNPRLLEYWRESGDRPDHCAVVDGDDEHPRLRTGCDRAPFHFDVAGRRVTVGFADDYKIHVRLDGTRDELVLDPAGQGYLSRQGGNVSALVVDGIAPVPLIKLASRPEACADFWDIYVSVVDGVPRKALELFGVADPPAMMSSTVKFARDEAVVTTRTSEDEGGHARIKRVRYRWNGTVFAQIVPTSKRAPGVSK